MLPINSHATVRYVGLKDIDGNYINDATITVIVQDRATGAAIAGITTLTLTYISDSDGNYQADIPYSQTANLTQDQELTLVYTITANSKQTVEKEDVVAGYPGIKAV